MDGLHGSLRAVKAGVDISEIAKIFGGGGHTVAAAFHIPGVNLAERQEEIIQKIKAYQLRRVS